MDHQPLSITFDTTKVKTGIPIIADGAMPKCRFVDCKESETDKGKMLTFEYHTLEQVSDIDGKTLNPGFIIRERITLYDKDTPPGEIPERAMTRISKRQDAFLGTGDPGNNKGKPERPAFGPQTLSDMLGKEAYIKVKAKVGGEFEGNDVVSTTFPGDMQA